MFTLGVTAAVVVTAVAVSPVLASWSQVLTAAPVPPGWWMPRRVAPAQWLLTAAVAILLSVPAAGLRPWPAWVLFAAGGAVLAVVDVRTHRLPAKLVYPLAAVTTTALLGASLVDGNWATLGRAGLACAAVGGLWFLIWLVWPAAVGLGDVRVFALAAGLAGYQSWSTVLLAQALIPLVAGLCSYLFRIGGPSSIRPMVAMGPGLIAGTIIAAWITG